ncbi:MAG: nicotinate phosphoribosyltransferase [Candidatus Paceibacterota bacterium]
MTKPMVQSPLLWERDAPIVRRADENDVYKILMMYLIWKYYPNLQVKFSFTNRTVRVPLSEYVDVLELQEHLNEVAKLRFTEEVVSVFREWDMFSEGFLQELAGLKLCAPKPYHEDHMLRIDIEGSWLSVTLWEIYILSIVSELYGRDYARKHGLTEVDLWNEGNRRLDEKIKLFNQHPNLRIAQFGLRRRFSGLWEEHVTKRLLEECPGIITGVSNMYLANKFGVAAQGTNAHELPMALVALARHESPAAMREAPYKVLKLWQRLYGHKSLIILDDAYGSDTFSDALPRHYIDDFRGFRHDSGDPFKYGNAKIKLYEKYDIDPRDRLLIFSDGLNPKLMIELLEYFADRIKVAFGVGTNLTNDLGLVTALSLVMKIVSAAGNPAVKLSNNLDKATGPADEIEYVKDVFGYTNTDRFDVVY